MSDIDAHALTLRIPVECLEGEGPERGQMPALADWLTQADEGRLPFWTETFFHALREILKRSGVLPDAATWRFVEERASVSLHRGGP